MKEKHLTSPLTAEEARSLRAGENVLLSGVIYTARDAAHARLTQALQAGEDLPVDLREQTIFYAGPCPTPPGHACGSIGPTTAYRMDAFTPGLLHYGLRAMIGKGDRGPGVRQAMEETGAVYFTAVGGCAATMAVCVESVEVVAYEDLGTESLKRLVVKDLPLTVAMDCVGGNAYEDGRAAWMKQQAEIQQTEPER